MDATYHSEDFLADTFEFLDQLRESGRVHTMFDAGLYLRDEYGMKHADSRALLSAWWRTFNREETTKERASRFLRDAT